jgi:hypothetical protein
MTNISCPTITVRPSIDRKEYDRQYRLLNKERIKAYEQINRRITSVYITLCKLSQNGT